MGVVVAVSMAQAVPIKSISVTDVGTSFVGGVGNDLTMSDVGSINVEYADVDNTVTPYAGGQFYLQTTLVGQSSTGGIASGNFANGWFSYKKSDGTTLLSGAIEYFNLVEVFNNSGMFAGEGYFTVLGGSLQANFGANGNMVDISFSGPKNISNFDSAFTCSSDMTILPVPNQTPEPATITLLCVGALALLRRKNSK